MATLLTLHVVISLVAVYGAWRLRAALRTGATPPAPVAEPAPAVEAAIEPVARPVATPA